VEADLEDFPKYFAQITTPSPLGTAVDFHEELTRDFH
jgi:hypothetical protein